MNGAGLVEQIIARNESDDQYLYLHVTRGVAKRDHAFPKGVSPTVFIMSNPLLPPPAELLTTGVTAITAERQPLAAVRHQGNFTFAQRITAPDGD